MRYYGSTGKATTRDVALACLTTGTSVAVETTLTQLKITKVNGKFLCACKDHHAKCEMDKPLTALEWAETHLKQFHK